MGEYLKVEDFWLRSRVESNDSTDDTRIQHILNAASRWIDDFTHRDAEAFAVSGNAAAVRYYEGGSEELWIDECVSVGAVAISEDYGQTYTALALNTDYWLSDGMHYDRTPYRKLIINPNGSWSVFPSTRRAVKVTAVWGYSTAAPEPIKEALIILTRNLYMARDGGDDADRTIVTAEGMLLPAAAVPQRVKDMLKTYVRWRQ